MSTTTPKRLATSAPAAASNTTAYTAPAATTTITSSITICNTNAATDTVRVFAVTNGSSAGVGFAFIYDMTIPYGNSYYANIAIALNAGDFLVVYSLNGTSTFVLSGAEIT